MPFRSSAFLRLSLTSAPWKAAWIVLLVWFCVRTPALAQATIPALCRQLVLEGEAAQGNEWRQPIGYPAGAGKAQDWLLRLVPLDAAQARTLSRGWDLALSPAGDQNYPDALLLASPPYGSLNAREIATTYGMRAQDAVAWSPRHFRFLTSISQLARARLFYRQLLDARAAEADRQKASKTLLDLSAAAAIGRIDLLDAHLVAGAADPAPFAVRWAEAFAHTPHTLDSGSSTPLGSLHSLRFRVTLWLPISWNAPPGPGIRIAKCAE